MQYLNRHFVAVMMLVATTACSDSTTPRSLTPPTNEHRSSPRVEIRRLPVTPAQYHAQNRMDFVGVAHNRAMDQIRAEVRKSRPRDLCKVIERLAVAADLGPAFKGSANNESHRVRKAAFDNIGCRGRNGRGHLAAEQSLPLSGPGFALASYAQGEDADFSPLGWELVWQVGYAADAASSSADLAGMLAAISASAQSLTADEAAAIDAVTSVSLSSFEYWEQNGAAAAQEIQTAYGSCLSGGGGDGCYYATSAPNFRASAPHFMLVSNRGTPASKCEYNWRFVGAGDVWGATTGLTIGLKYAKTWQGAVVGLFAGAVVGSGGANVIESVRFFNCLYSEA